MKCHRIHGAFTAIVMIFGASETAGVAAGEELFAKYCASCHGKDGKAQTPIGRKLGVKDLTQSKAPEAEIRKQIVEGKRDEQGRDKMPAFKTRLSDDEINSLVTLVKQLRK